MFSERINDFLTTFYTCPPIILMNHLWTECAPFYVGASYCIKSLQFHNVAILLEILARKMYNMPKGDESGWEWSDLELFLMEWDDFISDVSWGTFSLSGLLLSAHYTFPGISTSPSSPPQAELPMMLSQNQLSQQLLICGVIMIYSLWTDVYNRKILLVL